MKIYYNETMENAEQYYRDADYNYTAKTIYGGGFTTRIDTSERRYFVTTRIDEDAEVVIMEIEPSIHCNEETRSQVSEYICKINSTFKCGNIRISSNGNIVAQTEQRFDDAPLSEEMFKTMEVECIKILDIFNVPLEKLSNSRLLEPYEADVEKMKKNHMKTIVDRIKRISDLISEDDDDDDDDDFSVSAPAAPGFLDFLRKRATGGDAFANEIIKGLNDLDDEESPDDPPTEFDSDDVLLFDSDGDLDISNE